MADYYPPPSFHFSVDLSELKPSPSKNDVLFQSVGGLTASMETESIKEGGQNRFEHVLPVRAKYDDIVLRRGLVTDSKIVTWIQNAIDNFKVKPIGITITLLNQKHAPLVVWKCTHVWPKKWSVADLNADKSEVLIETLELNCNFFTVEYRK
ncbi:MAG: phage tail protein [Bacteroidota bacterium]